MALKFMNFYNFLNKKNLISLLLIGLIVVISNRALFKDEILESDDYKHHAVRTASYYLAFKQGQFPVRWGPNLNQGYGYPSFNYMYHTPYAIGSTLHSIGFSIQESVNLTVLFSLLIGAFEAYFLVREYLKSERWRVILALFFVFNPYTLLNVYWRGAVGELLFYAFVPFFLISVKRLLKTSRSRYFLSTTFVTVFLVLSHLPSLIILAPLTIAFIFYETGLKIKLKPFLHLVAAGILGLLITAWYWAPAYFEQWMVTYQNGASLTQYSSQFVKLIHVFDIRKDIYSSEIFLDVIQVGGISVFAILTGLYLVKTSKKVVLWLGLIATSLFLLSDLSKFIWDRCLLLQYTQYPWKFLWIITIASIMILVSFLKRKKVPKLHDSTTFIILVLGLFFTITNYIATKGTSSRTDFDWYHPTFETGSSFDEHQPIWSDIPYFFEEEIMYLDASHSAELNQDNLKQYVHKFSDLEATVSKLEGTTIRYKVTPEQDIIVLHKRLFFPGWEASINGERVEFIDDIPEYNGVLAVSVPAQKSNVRIKFTGFTTLRRISEYISLITLILVAGSVIIKKYYVEKTDQ